MESNVHGARALTHRSEVQKSARTSLLINELPPMITTTLHFCLHGMSHRGTFPSWEPYQLSTVAHEVVSNGPGRPLHIAVSGPGKGPPLDPALRPWFAVAKCSPF